MKGDLPRESGHFIIGSLFVKIGSRAFCAGRIGFIAALIPSNLLDHFCSVMDQAFGLGDSTPRSRRSHVCLILGRELFTVDEAKEGTKYLVVGFNFELDLSK